MSDAWAGASVHSRLACCLIAPTMRGAMTQVGEDELRAEVQVAPTVSIRRSYPSRRRRSGPAGPCATQGWKTSSSRSISRPPENVPATKVLRFRSASRRTGPEQLRSRNAKGGGVRMPLGQRVAHMPPEGRRCVRDLAVSFLVGGRSRAVAPHALVTPLLARSQSTLSIILTTALSDIRASRASRTSSRACTTTAPCSGAAATVIPRPRRNSSRPWSRSCLSARKRPYSC